MIHQYTNIHPNAKIANNVTIEAFSTIYDDVEIDEGTWIGPNVTIMSGARIGKNCKIFPGAVISGTPQDLKYKGENTLTVIGDNTVIRECVTISKGTDDKMKTVIGSNCLLMAYVHIAHDCTLGDNCILSNGVQVAGHVEIHDSAIIGGTTAIHQFVRIGSHAFISGGSLVRKDVPPFIKAAREPLSYCGLNAVGLKRRGFSPELIANLEDIYRLIYLKGFNNSKAVNMILESVPASEQRDDIIKFVQESPRGIIKGYGSINSNGN
ncbi:MAG: UDP-N-acetylglucosamine acyltransferase [Arenicella sp.]|jgi:UDP-N-acetylglucosamine acyltransferase